MIRATTRSLGCTLFAVSLLLAGEAVLGDANGTPAKVDEQAVLKPYKKGAVRLVLSTDGKFLACANRSYAQEIIVWDVVTRKPLKTLKQDHVGGHLAFCPATGNLAVSGSVKGNYLVPTIPVVVIWDIRKGEKVRTLEYASGPLAYSPDGALLAAEINSKHFEVVLWDPRSGKELRRLEGHTSWLTGLAFSPDGKLLASSSWDGSVILWDVATRKKLAKWQPFTEETYCPTFSPDGKTLAACGYSHNREGLPIWGQRRPTIILWDIATRKEIKWLWPNYTPLSGLAFSPDGKLLIVGARNEDLEIMDLTKGHHWAYLWGRAETEGVSSLALSPDGKTVLTGYSNGEIGFWEVPKEKQKIDWEALEKRNDQQREEKKRKRQQAEKGK